MIFLPEEALTYTLTFNCKTYLFASINNSSEGLIKKVQTDYYTDTSNIRIAPRQIRYEAVPTAIKDYNNDDTARTNELSILLKQSSMSIVLLHLERVITYR